MKRMDLTQSVYTLSQQYPELVEILRQLGFTDIAKPGMLATAGRFMTIPRGAAMKQIDMQTVRAALTAQGFEVTGEEGQT